MRKFNSADTTLMESLAQDWIAESIYIDKFKPISYEMFSQVIDREVIINAMDLISSLILQVPSNSRIASEIRRKEQEICKQKKALKKQMQRSANKANDFVQQNYFDTDWHNNYANEPWYGSSAHKLILMEAIVSYFSGD